MIDDHDPGLRDIPIILAMVGALWILDCLLVAALG